MDFVVGGGIGEVTIHAWNGTEYAQVGETTGQGCNGGGHDLRVQQRRDHRRRSVANFDRGAT